MHSCRSFHCRTRFSLPQRQRSSGCPEGQYCSPIDVADAHGLARAGRAARSATSASDHIGEQPILGGLSRPHGLTPGRVPGAHRPAGPHPGPHPGPRFGSCHRPRSRPPPGPQTRPQTWVADLIDSSPVSRYSCTTGGASNRWITSSAQHRANARSMDSASPQNGSCCVSSFGAARSASARSARQSGHGSGRARHYANSSARPAASSTISVSS